MIFLLIAVAMFALLYWFESSMMDDLRLCKANKHWFFPYTFGLTLSKTIAYEVQFGYGCKYDIGEDQSDINKLFGVGYWFHHRNSARIGWRYYNDRIELHYYCYVNGKRITGLLGHAAMNKPVVVKYTYTKKAYIFEFNNEELMSVPHSGHSRFGYLLGTYFGGNRKAPHEMRIYMKKVK